MDKYCHGTILVQQQSRHQQPLYLLLSDVWASLSLITLRAPTLTGIDKNQLQWNNVNLGGKKSHTRLQMQQLFQMPVLS